MDVETARLVKDNGQTIQRSFISHHPGSAFHEKHGKRKTKVKTHENGHTYMFDTHAILRTKLRNTRYIEQ